MKMRLTSYTFNPSAKTITFPVFPSLTLNGFLLITNVTSNVIIYNFADSTVGGTLLNNVLTLTYNTAAMGAADSLQIWYDDGVASGLPTNGVMESGGSLTTSLDLLENILTELRVQTYYLQTGLGVRDDPDDLRRDEYYNNPY